MVEFPYRKEKSDLFGTVYRPIAAVNFCADDTEIMHFMFVDSGADITLVPRSIGEMLGLVYTMGEVMEIFSVSRDSIKVVIRSVKMKIGNNEFNARVAWSLREDVPLLLGRLDVFDKFTVTFDESSKKTIFKWNK